MRFERYPRTDDYKSTPRRVAAARRAVQVEHDRYALFPELVTHQSAEDRIAAISAGRILMDQEKRDALAKKWRQARTELHAMANSQKQSVMRYWQKSSLPGHPAYLLTIIREAKNGVSYWKKMAHMKRMQLVGAGRLASPWANNR